MIEQSIQVMCVDIVPFLNGSLPRNECPIVKVKDYTSLQNVPQPGQIKVWGKKSFCVHSAEIQHNGAHLLIMCEVVPVDTRDFI